MAKASKSASRAGAKASVWMDLARTLEDAYEYPLSNLSLGEGNSVRTLVVKGQRPREIMVPTALEDVYKNVYSDKDIYFDADGTLLAIRVTRPVLDTADVLWHAFEAYQKAYAADARGAYTASIAKGLSRLAREYRALADVAVRLQEPEEAERLYLRSAKISMTAPCDAPDPVALEVAESVRRREEAQARELARLEELRASAREILSEGERRYEAAMRTLDEAAALRDGQEKEYQRLQERFVSELRAAANSLEECQRVSQDEQVRARAEELLGGIRLFFAGERLDDLGH